MTKKDISVYKPYEKSKARSTTEDFDAYDNLTFYNKRALDDISRMKKLDWRD